MLHLTAEIQKIIKILLYQLWLN